MKLSFPIILFEGISLENKSLLQLAKRTSNPSIEAESRFLSINDRRTLLQACEQHEGKEFRVLRRQLKNLVEAEEDPQRTKLQTLTAFKEVLTSILSKQPHQWVFQKDPESGFRVPFFVRSIQENHGARFSPPNVAIQLEALCLGTRREETISVYNQTIRGKTFAEVLKQIDIEIETPLAVAKYQEELKGFHQYSVQTGEQFNVSGVVQVKSSENSWHAEVYSVPLPDEERSGIMVMDHVALLPTKSSETVADVSFWEEEEPQGVVELPLQPFVYMYDLVKHCEVIVHVASIKPYQYQEHIEDMLILPDEEKRLFQVLREGIALRDQDVVHGKTGGCLVIIQSEPGLGKTLTAQVFAEKNKRPLYELQCSQLGVDPVEIENNLRNALIRSRRWRAILLINEADVFVHQRGLDLAQNAIVGVFLRLLENLSGVCFLTTNRGVVIDNAVFSRSLIHLSYDYPDAEGRQIIFKDQARLQGVRVGDEICQALAQKYVLAGRDIRQLIKLAKLLHLSEGRELSLNDLEWALQWRKPKLANPKI